jgi:hypothetical protein
MTRAWCSPGFTRANESLRPPAVDEPGARVRAVEAQRPEEVIERAVLEHHHHERVDAREQRPRRAGLARGGLARPIGATVVARQAAGERGAADAAPDALQRLAPADPRA